MNARSSRPAMSSRRGMKSRACFVEGVAVRFRKLLWSVAALCALALVGTLAPPIPASASDAAPAPTADWRAPQGWKPPTAPLPPDGKDPAAPVAALPELAPADPPPTAGAQGRWRQTVAAGMADVQRRAKDAASPPLVSSAVDQPGPATGAAVRRGEPEQAKPSEPIPTPSAGPAGAAGTTGVLAAVATQASTTSPQWCTSPDGHWGFSIEGVTQLVAVTNWRDGEYQLQLENRGTQSDAPRVSCRV